MSLNFALSSSAISGTLAGMNLHCVAHATYGAPALVPGEYDVFGPIDDPIYGRFALLQPAATPGGPAATYKETSAQKWMRPSPAAYKEVLAQKATVAPSASYKQTVAQKCLAVPSFSWKCMPSRGDTGAVVLTDRQISGRNCIVVTIGFADLMDALLSAGGARITLL